MHSQYKTLINRLAGFGRSRQAGRPHQVDSDTQAGFKVSSILQNVSDWNRPKHVQSKLSWTSLSDFSCWIVGLTKVEHIIVQDLCDMLFFHILYVIPMFYQTSMVEHNDLHCKWVNHSCCRQSLDELLKSTKILDKKVKLKEHDMYVPESCCKWSFWFYTLLSLGVNVAANNVVGFLVLETFPRRRSNFISWDHHVQSEAQILTFNPKALLYVCLFL